MTSGSDWSTASTASVPRTAAFVTEAPNEDRATPMASPNRMSSSRIRTRIGYHLPLERRLRDKLDDQDQVRDHSADEGGRPDNLSQERLTWIAVIRRGSQWLVHQQVIPVPTRRQPSALGEDARLRRRVAGPVAPTFDPSPSTSPRSPPWRTYPPQTSIRSSPKVRSVRPD
jgi:hypothetical protein